MHESVYDMTAGDARRTKLLRLSLEKLANGPDEVLKEMAEGVLAGNLDLRQAAASDVYGAGLGRAFDRFTTDYFDRLDDEERDQVVAEARGQLELLGDSAQSGAEG